MNHLRNQLLNHKLAKILELISVFLVAFIIIIIFLKPESDNLLYNQGVLWFANIAMLGMIWAGLKIRRENWKTFGLGFGKTTLRKAFKIIAYSLLVFVLALLGFMVGSIIMANISGVPQSTDMSGYQYLKDNMWMLFLTLAGVYIASSWGEEVIYRAFLINRIAALLGEHKMAKILAVILSAIIFGLAHYSWGPMGIVQTAFMGLALGLCYVFMKKGLWPLVFAHAYMDTILMVQLYLASN